MLGENHIWMSRSDTLLTVRKEMMLSRTNLDWLHPSSCAFLSQEISHLVRNSWSSLRSLVAPQWHCKNDTYSRRKDLFNCVQAVLCKCFLFSFLSHGYGNFAWVCECVHVCANEGCCLRYLGDIEICNTEFTGESILTLLTHIFSDVGLMFSHDGRTARWGTDGSNCLINLELLNISVHKVEETKYAFCSRSESQLLREWRSLQHLHYI